MATTIFIFFAAWGGRCKRAQGWQDATTILTWQKTAVKKSQMPACTSWRAKV
jgi:hypothetical protein